ncbi:MAG TPA: class I SAM-dependent methyltransferase [Vitreimonas sp.]|nr:class I SAM-dependent methyltransferase [Vitreimonas sp.]
MKINKKFQSTVEAYNQFAPQFIKHLEAKVSNIEMDKFDSHVQGGYILDAGCGSCRDAAQLIKRGYKVLGIDASEGLLNEAKKIHPEVPTQLMSLTELEFETVTFNGVWCRATLLHIDRDEVPKVLSNFHKILKSQGILYIQTKKGEGEGTQPVPFDPSMTRFFTFFEEKELCQLVTNAGFEIVESYTYDTKDREKSAKGQEWVVIFARKI